MLVRTTGRALTLVCCCALLPVQAGAATNGVLARVIRPLLGFPAPFRLCGEQRLITRNISFVYPDLLAELRQDAHAQERGVLASLEDFAESDALDLRARERCRWNKFRLLLQVSYFEVYDDLLPPGRAADDTFARDALALRSRLFAAWAESDRALLEHGAAPDFHEWAQEVRAGEPLHQFLSRESKVLPWMSHLARTFVTPPRFGRDDAGLAAEATLHSWLRMRTPLSSIWPELALQEAQRPGTAEAMACLRAHTAVMSCQDNLYQLARSCASADASAGLPLTLLGLFSAQEAFLLRDLGAWVQHNLGAAERTRALDVFRDGAEIYYRSQEVGARCGSQSLFPPSTAGRQGSGKSYHFYAMALNAYKLRQVGFSPAVAASVPARTGALYKRWAFALGLIYNLVVGLPLDAGATGDVPGVLAVQQRGASFGVELYDRDLDARRRAPPRVRARSANLERLPLSARYVERWRWDLEHEGRLIVDLVEVVGALPLRRSVKIELSPRELAGLREAGVVMPRVMLGEDRLLVIY